jgi:hypothetical protein
MFKKVGRGRYLQIGGIFLLLALVALAGMQTRNGSTPTSDNPNAPRMMGVNGGQPVGGGAVDAQIVPFETGSATKFDVSPPLRDIKPNKVEPWTEVREMTEPKGDESNRGKALPPVTDPVVQSNFGPDALLAMPAPIRNFAGLNNRNGVYPPDTNGDVGPNHYVQWVNLSIQMFDKNGNTVYGPVNGNTLWSGFGGACQSQNAGDPIVLYDPMADRWLMSQFTSSSPYGECIAISTTGDPTGSYYRYFFQFSTSVFYDYPHLGVWPDGYYAGFNRFGAQYQGPSAIVFDRAKMLLGQPATYQAFNLSTSYGTLLPSDLDGATLPPAGSPNFFMARGTNSLQLWKFKVNWTTPSSSTFTGPTTMATASYNVLCPTTRSCIPQPSTSVRLDGIGDRLMYRLAYRNFGTHESLVVNHSVNAASSGTRAGVRWYEVRNPNVSPVIYQQSTYSPDTTNRWMGSVAMDGAGNMAMVYSVSSASVSPGIRYAGRLVTDPLSTMAQGEATLINGSGSQTGTGSRWGDYAMMAVDPTDDCTFWMTTEYMATTGQSPWVTRIGSFKFPNCGGAPPPTNTPGPTPTNTPVPPTPTNTPVVPTPTPVPGGCGERLTNTGFESGTAPWVQSSTGGYQLIDTTRPRTGSYSAYMGGYNNGTDTLYQQVTIPSNATSATMSYWRYVTTQESGSTPYDYLYVEVRSTTGALLGTLQTVSNGTTPKNSWVQTSNLNLIAYKGQTVRIQFRATTDPSLVTSFFVDDVSVNTCQ